MTTRTLASIEQELRQLDEESRHLTNKINVAMNACTGTSEVTVALVGCGKAKVSGKDAVRARDLYRGVPFRLAFKHGLMTADDVHILSALYGLVDPYTHLVPYDFSMVQLPPTRHLAWGKKVLDDLRAAYPMTRLKVIFYAGQQYVRPIMRAITDESAYWTFSNPLAGLDMFERIAWFKDQERFWSTPF